MRSNPTSATRFSDGVNEFEGELWAEKIKLVSGWSVLAEFSTGPYAGSPCVIEKVVGAGRHIHIATCPPATPAFFDWLLKAIGIESVVSHSADVQLIPLAGANRKFVGAINFSEDAQSIEFQIKHAGVCFSLDSEQGLKLW